MRGPFDTIVAPITGNQPAPVAIIRISGPEAWAVASEVFPSWPATPDARRAMYGRFVTGDDGFALPFETGHSYTGEEAVELSCHGSRAAVRALVRACVEAGARTAEPGEFTQRAFLHGRLDLTEAEAVRDTVEAETDAQLRFANLQRGGALRLEVSLIRESLLRLLASVEASVDFEEEIGPIDRGLVGEDLGTIENRLQALLATAPLGRIMRRGLRIAIVGPPNVGKSSLLNALLGSDRAIVTDVPGTTRDFVEERVDLAGVPTVLIDTAGLRETSDPVEAIGVQRARAQAAHADLVWYLYDAAQGFQPGDQQAVEAFLRPATTVANKVDLAPAAEGHLGISAKTLEGLDRLVATVARFAEQAAALTVPALDERHGPSVEAALEAVQQARMTLEHGRPDDLISVHLRTAADSLGQITGETAAPDMVERIFRDFCIGK